MVDQSSDTNAQDNRGSTLDSDKQIGSTLASPASSEESFEQSPTAGGVAAGIASGLSAALSERLGQVDFRGLADRATEFTSELGSSVGSYVQEFASDIPAKSRELGGRIDKHARANPWLHIGAVGAGALAIGFLLGRSFANSDDSSESGK